MAQELEIKLSLARPDLEAAFNWLLAQPAARDGGSRLLVNRYFDTPNADLNKRRIALRVRQAGDQYIQTLKTQGDFVDGAHRRQEWEWPLSGPELDMALLADTPVGQGGELSDLRPVFETNFLRRVVMLKSGDTTIECAVDSGQITTNAHSRPLDEVEFELKSGDASQLVAKARELALQVPVFLNLISKAEQGYYLAGLHAPACDTNLGSDDPVSRFLHRLSIGWLTEGAVTVDKQTQDALADVASRRSVGCQWEQIRQALLAGTSVSQLASTKALGQLQLGIAAG